MGKFVYRCYLATVIFALMTSLVTPGARAMSTDEMAKRKPHVILIVADDLGWNDVSWNNPNVYMPNMDALAKNGIIMNQAYVQPTCTPTRAALMTGRYPFTMGLQSGVIKPTDPRGVPLRAQMLPEILKWEGYDTHAVGKWHLGFCSWDYAPTNRGFDSFYGFYTGAEDYYTHRRATPIRPALGKFARMKNWTRDYLDLRNNTRLDYSKDGRYSTELFASVAEDIVRNRSPENPMFLYLAFQAVHSPLQVPRSYLRFYEHVQDQNRKLYLGMVTAMDEAIGRLVTALKETGHYDNTVIIFTSDNGGSPKSGGSNWPLEGGKSKLWEGGTRAPAFIHSPLLPNPGTTSDQLHHATDWYNTIGAIAGGKVPDVDGFNQWDALTGIAQSPRTKMIYNIETLNSFRAGVRLSDYKMIVGAIYRKSDSLLPPADGIPQNPESTDEANLMGNDDIPQNPESTDEANLMGNDGIPQNPESTDEANLMGNDGIPQNPESTDEANLTGNDDIPQNPESTDEANLMGNGSSSARRINLNIVTFNDYAKRITLPEIKVQKELSFHRYDQPRSKTLTSKFNETIYVISHADEDTEDIDQTNRKQRSYTDDTNQNNRSLQTLREGKETLENGNEPDFIRWKNLMNHSKINWNPKVLKILNKYMKRGIKIRLFNLKDDPREMRNLSSREPRILKKMLNDLARQLKRYVTEKIKIRDTRAHPVFWKNVWSPGWCLSKW